MVEMEHFFLSILELPEQEQIAALEQQYANEWEAFFTIRPQERGLAPTHETLLKSIREASLWQKLFGPSHLQRLQAAFARAWAMVDTATELGGMMDPARAARQPMILPKAVTKELVAFDKKHRKQR